MGHTMELELRRESVRCWETVCRTTVEQEETAEMIVPDACPDIWQVLDGAGKLLLQRKEAMEGKAELAGLLKVGILYQPEGDGPLESMEVTLPLSAAPDLPMLTRRCLLRVQPRVLSVDVHLLNPRKVLVRATWQMEVEGFAPQTLALAAGTEEAEAYGIRQRTDRFQSLLTVNVQEKNFTYSDTLTLPAGRPTPARILGTWVEAACSEARVIGSKLVFKGEATLRVLCRGEDGGVFGETFHLPYSQLMDAGESSEEALCDLHLLFTDVTCVLDGEDPRAFQVELTIQALAVLRKQTELPVLADLYSTDYDLTVAESPVTAWTLRDRGEDQETLRATLPAQSLPVEIIEVQASLGRAGQRQEGEERVLTQEVRLMVLYWGEDGPVCLGQTVTVEHRLSGPWPCAFTAELLRALTASAAGEGVEVSCALAFRWMALEGGPVSAVERVTVGERLEPSADRPSVLLRAVRSGESLWDVAKACRATDQVILEASGLTSPDLCPGQVLLIPR